MDYWLSPAPWLILVPWLPRLLLPLSDFLAAPLLPLTGFLTLVHFLTRCPSLALSLLGHTGFVACCFMAPHLLLALSGFLAPWPLAGFMAPWHHIGFLVTWPLAGFLLVSRCPGPSTGFLAPWPLARFLAPWHPLAP